MKNRYLIEMDTRLGWINTMFVEFNQLSVGTCVLEFKLTDNKVDVDLIDKKVMIEVATPSGAIIEDNVTILDCLSGRFEKELSASMITEKGTHYLELSIYSTDNQKLLVTNKARYSIGNNFGEEGAKQSNQYSTLQQCIMDVEIVKEEVQDSVDLVHIAETSVENSKLEAQQAKTESMKSASNSIQSSIASEKSAESAIETSNTLDKVVEMAKQSSLAAKESADEAERAKDAALQAVVQANSASSVANQASINAEQSLRDTIKAKDTALQAQSSATSSATKAKDAEASANNSKTILDKKIVEVDGVKVRVDDAVKIANESVKKADISIAKADNLTTVNENLVLVAGQTTAIAEEAITTANKANNTANENLIKTTEQANISKQQVALAKTEVVNAQGKVELAATEVTKAKAEVTKATEQVGLAQGEVNKARAEVVKATEKATEATNQADRSKTEADRAGVAANIEAKKHVILDGTEQANFNFISKGDSISGLKVGQKTYDFVSDVKKYSVRFTGSNPVGIREDDAVGMIAEVGVDDQVVRNDFDNVSFFDRPICCGDYQADGSFKINAYKGEPTFGDDGTNGNVWRECKPYYWDGDIDNYLSATATPLEGYKLAPGFKNGVDKVYLPCEFMSLLNGKPASVSGQYPLTGSCNSFMSEARKYNTNAHLETIDWLMNDYILQTIEFATKDKQTVMMGCCNLRYNGETDTAIEAGTNANRIVVATSIASNYVVGQTICIGTGRNGDNVKKFTTITAIEDSGVNKAIVFDGDSVNIGIGNFISSRPYKCGATNTVAASSGSPVSNTSGKYPCIWRGKVSPWGDGFSTLCDVLAKRYGTGATESPYSYKPNYLQNPTKYANGAITDDYVELTYNLPTGDGYIKTLGLDSRYEHVKITEALGGASTTYHGAYYYYPRYDICSARVGGRFATGRACSPVYFHCTDAPSTANLDSLSRLFVYRS